MSPPVQRWLLPLCLTLTWLVWGSTYLAIKVALEGFPPFMLSGLRYLAGGLLMLVWLVLSRSDWPNWRQVRNASFIGVLMLTAGNGLLCVAEQHVASGAAALIVAATPVLTVLFNQWLGRRARPIEWLGLGLGVTGVALMQFDARLAAEPWGVAQLVLACVAWAAAGAMMPRLDLPQDSVSTTIQMLVGGALSLPVALLAGEDWPTRLRPDAVFALFYLSIFGSMLAYSAYVWLLRTQRPALATSCCYVNPVVALGLGWAYAGEAITWPLVAGMVVILAGVMALSRPR